MSSFTMNSKQFGSSYNFSSLLWGYYSFGLWLVLELKLIIRIIGTGAMVGIKLEGGGYWKRFEKLIM